MTTPTSTPSAVRSHPADQLGTYRLDVAGHLDDHWSDWLGDVDLVHNDDATTTITVAVVDQAQLHGLLVGVRDIGSPLLALHRVDMPAAASAETTSDDRTDGLPALGRVLHTERLTLRAAVIADADETWSYRRLESVNEWLTGVSQSRTAYREQFGEPSRLANTVIVELNEELGGTLIGDFMLRREDAWAQAEVAEQASGAEAELGWVLDPVHTGVGYATEAARALLDYCFAELGVHRVVASCFLDNDTSWRLMERLGMRRETHAVAESLHRSGRWLDTVTYAVTDSEWHASHQT
jgi:RimJ/RimL family protein N-acetyltransferase